MTFFSGYENRAFIGEGPHLSDEVRERLAEAEWRKCAEARLEQAKQELEAEGEIKKGGQR